MEQKDADEKEESGERVLQVWEDCADAVDVFRVCPIESVGAGFGIYWTGISPSEIESACNLLSLPEEVFASIVNDVTYMGKIVANHRNEKLNAAQRK